MARRFDGSTQYWIRAAALIAAQPITISSWIFGASQSSVIASIGKSTGIVGNFDNVELRQNTLGIRALSLHGAGSGISDTAAGLLFTPKWNHGAAVFLSNTSRTAYANGIAATTNTTSVAPTGFDSTVIGVRTAAASVNFYAGLQMHTAMWASALAAAEVYALSCGWLPRMIQPTALKAWWELRGVTGQELDVNGSNALTNTSGSMPGVSGLIYKSRFQFYNGARISRSFISRLALLGVG